MSNHETRPLGALHREDSLKLALHHVNSLGAILQVAAMRGTKAKPTMAELNEVLDHQHKAQVYIRAAQQAAEA